MWMGLGVLWFLGWAVFGLPWTGFTGRPRASRLNLIPFRRSTYRRRDLVLNFVYYVPLGIIGAGLGWGSGAILAAATALSGGTELIQMFSRDRYPSVTDVILNVCGAAAGVVFALAIRRIRGRRSPPTRAGHGTRVTAE
jgi:glycopeptide antibiotics resistance protein